MPLTVDDAQLLRMAAEPPRDAARVLSRAESLSPVVWLLLVVLPLLGATCAPLEQSLAVWGIKAMSVAQADRLEEVLIPGLGWRDDEALYEPPLLAWTMAVSRYGFPRGSVPGLQSIIVLSLILAGFQTYLWMRNAGGAAFGILSSLLLAIHSQWLLLCFTGNADALTLCCLASTGYGVWRHWQNSQTLVSGFLLCAGLSWGAALLSGGVLAVAFLGVLLLWSQLSASNERQIPSGSDAMTDPAELQPLWDSRWARFWSLVILFATGTAVGGWWWAMMAEEYGWSFVVNWLTLAADRPPGSFLDAVTPHEQLLSWFRRSAFLSGVWLLGIWAGLKSLVRRDATPAGRIRELMTIWFVCGTVLRAIPIHLFVDDTHPTSSWQQHWESFSVIPATCLAADGLVQLLRRQVSNRSVLVAVAVTSGWLVAMWIDHWGVGVVVGLCVALMLAASAPLSLGLRRSTLVWSEAELRRGIQFYAVVIVLGHGCLGGDLWWQPDPGRKVYATTRVRLLQLEEPPDQISIVTSENAEDPAQIEFLVRSLFPQAVWSRSVGWDPALTQTIVSQYRQPRSRLLVVEWGRKELRLRADIGTGWQVRPILDQSPYLGRRLAINLIEPARNGQVSAVSSRL